MAFLLIGFGTACSAEKSGSGEGTEALNPGSGNPDASVPDDSTAGDSTMLMATGSGEPGDDGDGVSFATEIDEGQPGMLGADAGSCAGETYAAELASLDIYVMLDRSLSMNELTPLGVSKWDAIRSALRSFVTDPASKGIGVGIQYFPSNAPCGDNDECEDGHCYLKVCNNTLDFVPCLDASHCPGEARNTCVSLGECGADSCRNVGSTCGVDADAGVCEEVGASVCVSDGICDLTAYRAPSVAIAALPDAEDALLDSIDEHGPAPLPFGFTPTGPALEGAIAYAKDWAERNPEHRVVTLLATDGSPTQCAPSGTSAVAALAAVGVGTTPRVQTFTIGVFSDDDDEGPTNLEAIARAGQGQAFIIDDNDDVAQRFIEALIAIRGDDSLECEFNVPDPETGERLNYNRVNVEIHRDGGPTTLPFVDAESQCEPTGGWYYDVSPSEGRPGRILLCDSSCASLEGDVSASLEIRIGCVTERLLK